MKNKFVQFAWITVVILIVTVMAFAPGLAVPAVGEELTLSPALISGEANLELVSMEALAFAPEAADRTIEVAGSPYLMTIDSARSAAMYDVARASPESDSSLILVAVLLLSTTIVLVVATRLHGFMRIGHYRNEHLEAQEPRGGVELKFPMMS